MCLPMNILLNTCTMGIHRIFHWRVIKWNLTITTYHQYFFVFKKNRTLKKKINDSGRWVSSFYQQWSVWKKFVREQCFIIFSSFYLFLCFSFFYWHSLSGKSIFPTVKQFSSKIRITHSTVWDTMICDIL
jgi:hypothetical protein